MAASPVQPSSKFDVARSNMILSPPRVPAFLVLADPVQVSGHSGHRLRPVIRVRCFQTNKISHTGLAARRPAALRARNTGQRCRSQPNRQPAKTVCLKPLGPPRDERHLANTKKLDESRKKPSCKRAVRLILVNRTARCSSLYMPKEHCTCSNRRQSGFQATGTTPGRRSQAGQPVVSAHDRGQNSPTRQSSIGACGPRPARI